MRMDLRSQGWRRRNTFQKRRSYRRQSRKRCGSRALSEGAGWVWVCVVMPRAIVAMMMPRLRRISIAHDDREPPIDWSEHKARRNEGTQAQQSE
jgi:hypothetical protein